MRKEEMQMLRREVITSLELIDPSRQNLRPVHAEIVLVWTAITVATYALAAWAFC